jgi:hypothetical protein
LRLAPISRQDHTTVSTSSTVLARRGAAPLIAFARGYLENHVCIKAPNTTRLAAAIRQAMNARPGTTAPAAASGICNPTR